MVGNYLGNWSKLELESAGASGRSAIFSASDSKLSIAVYTSQDNAIELARCFLTELQIPYANTGLSAKH